MRLMLLSTVLAVVAWNQAVFSAPAKGCSYSPLQQVIRTARTDADILKLIDNQVNLNIKPRCGGNVMQLAILRGNPSLVKILIDQGGLDLNEPVENEKEMPKNEMISLQSVNFAYEVDRPILKDVNVVLEDNKMIVKFKEKERAITKGQSVVLYDKDMTCLGGGIIKEIL